MVRITLILLLLTGCATTPEPVSYADIAAKYAEQKQVYEPVNYQPRPVNPQMCGDMICFSEADFMQVGEDIERMQSVIQHLNQTVFLLTESRNALMDSVGHCEYSNQSLRAAISNMETAQTRSDIGAQVKQILLAGTCGLLLWGK